MTHATERVRAGRKPCVIAELHLDTCSNTYGVAPCTAAGTARCYNTYNTCQDTPNFRKTTKTYRFAENLPGLPLDQGILPTLVSYDFAPTAIEPGKALGRRAKVTLRLVDHPHHDRDIDPYLATRTGAVQGTFWGKLAARNRYYEGRRLTLYSGYLGDGNFSFTNFISRVYVLDSIDGPDSAGRVTVTAKDYLKLADDKRAQCPRPSESTLNAALAETVTAGNITLDGSLTDYADWAANAQHWVRIGKEVLYLRRVTGTGTAFVIVARGQWGTTAESHDVGDSVQRCVHFFANGVDVTRSLLVDYAGIPAALINDADWVAEKTNRLSFFLVRTLITKPEGVTKLLSELVRQGQFSLWWDEEAQLIRLRHALSFNRCEGLEPFTLNDDDHLVQNTVRVKRRAADRLTEAWVYYGLVDYTGDLKKAENFRSLHVFVDTEAESVNAWDDRRVEIIYSRWLFVGSSANAAALATALVSRFRDTPLDIEFELDGKDSHVVTGSFVQLDTRTNQNVDGTHARPILQVVTRKEADAGHRYALKAVSVVDGDVRFANIGPDALPEYPAATDDQKCRYAFVCADSAVFPSDGAAAYRIT